MSRRKRNKKENLGTDISNKIEKEFNLRERRLKLVYRILYIVVAMWLTLLISYISITNKEAPIYCGVLAFLTTFVIDILYYIFSELRCMKIREQADEAERKLADNKFLEIWDFFGFLLVFSFVLVIFDMYFPKMINKWSTVIVIVVGSSILSAITFIKDTKIKSILRNVIILIIFYFFFAAAQIPEFIANVSN